MCVCLNRGSVLKPAWSQNETRNGLRKCENLPRLGRGCFSNNCFGLRRSEKLFLKAMINKEKFLEYLRDQLPEHFKQWIDPDDGGTLSNRVIHSARLEDIINRALHQVVANAIHCVFGRGGIPVARTNLEKSRADNVNWLALKGALNLKIKGSVIEGTGKEGYKPVYLSDTGFFGHSHPRFLPGYEPLAAAGVGSLQNRFLMKMKQWSFAEVPEPGEEPEFKEVIDVYPGKGVTDERFEGSTIIPNNNRQVRFVARLDDAEHNPSNGWQIYTLSQFLTEECGGNVYAAALLEGEMRAGDGIDNALVAGVVSIEDESSEDLEVEFLGGIYDAVTYYEQQDFAGASSDKFMQESEAMILSRLGFKISRPRTVVIPGQRSEVPRVSSLRVDRPLPSIFGATSEKGVPQIASTKMNLWLGFILGTIEAYETDLELQLETQPKLKEVVKERKKRGKQCLTMSAARLEAYLLKTSLSDKIDEICYDTNDNAERRNVKKYSLKNA